MTKNRNENLPSRSTEVQETNPYSAALTPITISAPGIHYTSAGACAALIDPDSVLFVAYNKTYEKRVLHPLKLQHGFCLYKERPLYQETSFSTPSTTTLLELLTEKFCEDPASLHLLVPRPDAYPKHPGFGKGIDHLEEELSDLRSKLPFKPLNTQIWTIPKPRISTSSIPPKPRLIVVTASQPCDGPVFLGGFSIHIDRGDVVCAKPPATDLLSAEDGNVG